MKKLSKIKEGCFPSSIKTTIISELGISVDISENKNGEIAIKIKNHLSLFAVIRKIKRDFDFIVVHEKNCDEFILLLGEKTI